MRFLHRGDIVHLLSEQNVSNNMMTAAILLESGGFEPPLSI